jgi:pimeloyl-ACP methyl ester carboxylesterase
VEDVKAVTAKLGVDKFFLMAHSAGGPNALNVAAALGPSRVLGLGVLAGETEYTKEGAPQVPGGVKCFMGTCVGGCCIPACPCVCDWGFFGDWKLKHDKYPYEPEDIAVPTILYYAEKDDIIDANLTNFTAARVRGAKVEMIPGKDHFSCATPEFQRRMAVELIAAAAAAAGQ